ncbi:MAG TPA: hypothetical protein VFI00_11760 [Kribbella sp.]|nr:hypothetical protein [Kribbella sp.]
MRTFVTTAVTASLALSLVACGGSKTDTTAAPSTTQSSTPTPTPVPTTSSTPSAAPTTPAAPAPRTKASLTKALLALEDLQPGFAIDPDAEGDDGTKLTSTNAKCAKLVKLFNAETSPGARVVVTRGFSGGQDGPFVQETLEAMPSAKATTAHLATIKAAVKSCTKAKLSISGAGTSTVAITEVAAPKAGSAPVAVRFAADSGPLEGLEVTFAFAGLNDVLLSMNFDFADIELPALDASKKASKVLGTTTTGA